MTPLKNAVKEKLLRREPSFGIFLLSANSIIAEACAAINDLLDNCSMEAFLLANEFAIYHPCVDLRCSWLDFRTK